MNNVSGVESGSQVGGAGAERKGPDGVTGEAVETLALRLARMLERPDPVTGAADVRAMEERIVDAALADARKKLAGFAGLPVWDSAQLCAGARIERHESQPQPSVLELALRNERAMRENLTRTQARCTELRQELEALRKDYAGRFVNGEEREMLFEILGRVEGESLVDAAQRVANEKESELIAADKRADENLRLLNVARDALQEIRRRIHNVLLGIQLGRDTLTWAEVKEVLDAVQELSAKALTGGAR